MFRKAGGLDVVVHVGIVFSCELVHPIVPLLGGHVCVAALRRHVAIEGDGDEDRIASSTKVGGRAEQSRTLDGALYR